MENRYAKEIIPLEGWEREETFHFFKGFSQPFFNVHTEVVITPLYQYCKSHRLPLSLAYMYATLRAARNSEHFKLRIQNGLVVKFAGLDLSTTILKSDKTISFTHLPYHDTLESFCEEAKEIVEKVKSSKKLFNGYQGADMLHMTTLPWFKFKGMEHAFNLNEQDQGIPKIAFGQIEHQQNKIILPISIGLHHALADGYHMHLFLQDLEAVINTY